MRADTDILHDEARGKLKKAMTTYPGADVHVTIYVLRQLLEWNDLQVALARSDHPSDPSRIKRISTAVEDHIEGELSTYLDIGHDE